MRASVRQGNGSAPSGRPPGGRGPGGSRLRLRGPDDAGHSLAMLPRGIVRVVRNSLICRGEGGGKGASYPTGTASSAGIGVVGSRLQGLHERSWERRVRRRGRPARTGVEPCSSRRGSRRRGASRPHGGGAPPEMRMRAGHARSEEHPRQPCVLPLPQRRAGHQRSQAATALWAGHKRTQEHPRGGMDGRSLPAAGVSRLASPSIWMYR